MCAGKSSIKPAESEFTRTSRQGSPDLQHRREVTLHLGALYRVLRCPSRGGRRSVDRKSAGRNASEAIELRHLVKQSVGAEQVCSSEGNTRPMGRRPTGVQGHGMFSRFDWEPRRSGGNGSRARSRAQEPENALRFSLEVRSLHSSEEVG
jgi:hypothetical protein